MKVKISELRPNPFRNIEHYPIDAEKVKTLVASIGQTGFWDNILARKEDGQIQIAYGHHRLAALKKAMKPSDSVDIPVKPLDDATMLKIMANENMDEWKTSPGVIDETVRATRKFLEEHPEEKKKLYAHGRITITGAPMIAKFLGWDEDEKTGAWNPDRIRYALERLGLIDEGIVEPEAIRNLPTERAARDFVKAVKQFKPTHVQQKKAAEQIVAMAKGDRGEAAVRGAITEQIYRREKPGHRDFKLIELREEIKDTEKLARDLSSKLLTLMRFKEEVKDQVYRAEIGALAIEFNVLIQRLKSFIGGKNNVKQIEG
jgi:ParB-like chromosome segregation protein Spo0J